MKWIHGAQSATTDMTYGTIWEAGRSQIEIIYSFSNITWCSVYSMFQHFFLPKGTPHLLSSNFGIRRPTKQDLPQIRPSFKSGMHHNSASSSVLMAGITQPHVFHASQILWNSLDPSRPLLFTQILHGMYGKDP